MKKILNSILFIMSFLLCGCDNGSIQKGEGVELDYKECFDCGIAMLDSVDSHFIIKDEMVIFANIEVDKNGVAYLRFNKGDLFSDSFYTMTDICLEYENVEAFCVKGNPNSNDYRILVAQREEETGQIHIKEFAKNGEEKDLFSVSEEDLEYDVVHELSVVGDKLFLLTHDNLFMICADGKINKCDMPQNTVFFDSLQRDNGIILLGNEGGEKQAYLIDENGKTEKVIPISKNSDCFMTCNNSLFYIENRSIYQVDLLTENVEQVVDFSDEKDFQKQFISVVNKDDKYGVFYISAADGAYRTVLFNNQKKKTPKIELTIYDPTGIANSYQLNTIVDSFNEVNSQYRVNIKEYEQDLNYIIVSKEQPDLIFLDDIGTYTYGDGAGVLENLTSYLENEKSDLEADLLQGLTEKLKVNNKVYVLPNSIEIETLCGYESDIPTKEGWSTDEFLDWLLENPDALEDSWLGRINILSYCLEGSMDHFVDYENGKVDFDNEEFRNLLLKCKNVTEYPKKDLMPAMAGKVMDVTFFGTYDLFMKNINAPLIYKGYPTYDGKTIHRLKYYGVGIFSSSKNKEGAFEFIKYYMRYRYSDRYAFSVSTSLLEKNYEINENSFWPVSNGDNIMASYGKKEVETLMRLFANSDIRDVKTMNMQSVILDETLPYFNQDKNLDEVIDVIQARVQLMLDESS